MKKSEDIVEMPPKSVGVTNEEAFPIGARQRHKVGRPRLPDDQLKGKRPAPPITKQWEAAFSALPESEQQCLLAEATETKILNAMIYALEKGLSNRLPDIDQIIEEGLIPLPDGAAGDIFHYIDSGHPLVRGYLNCFDMAMGPAMIKSIVKDPEFDDLTFRDEGLRTRLVVRHYEEFINTIKPWFDKYQQDIQPELVDRVNSEHARIVREKREYWEAIEARANTTPRDPIRSDPFDNTSADAKMAAEAEKERLRLEEQQRLDLIKANLAPKNFFPEPL